MPDRVIPFAVGVAFIVVGYIGSAFAKRRIKGDADRWLTESTASAGENERRRTGLVNAARFYADVGQFAGNMSTVLVGLALGVADTRSAELVYYGFFVVTILIALSLLTVRSDQYGTRGIDPLTPLETAFLALNVAAAIAVWLLGDDAGTNST